MKVAYFSEMSLPTYKTTRRQHIPEGTYMITLNLLKIFDSDMQLQDTNTQTLKTPDNVERIQECRETKLSRKNRGTCLDHMNFKHDSWQNFLAIWVIMLTIIWLSYNPAPILHIKKHAICKMLMYVLLKIINLKMAISAETCSWELDNKHLSTTN